MEEVVFDRVTAQFGINTISRNGRRREQRVSLDGYFDTADQAVEYMRGVTEKAIEKHTRALSRAHEELVSFSRIHPKKASASAEEGACS